MIKLSVEVNMTDKISFLDAFPPEWWKDYDKKQNILEDTYLNVKWKIDNIISFFRNIKYFFINVVKFRHILWNDRDWDFAYILEVLKLKLEKTRDLIVGNQFIADADEVGKQINKTLGYLNDFAFYDEIFEEQHQDLLRQAMNETNKAKKDELESFYIKEQYKFCEKSWLNLWKSIAKNMRGWWE